MAAYYSGGEAWAHYPSPFLWNDNMGNYYISFAPQPTTTTLHHHSNEGQNATLLFPPPQSGTTLATNLFGQPTYALTQEAQAQAEPTIEGHHQWYSNGSNQSEAHVYGRQVTQYYIEDPYTTQIQGPGYRDYSDGIQPSEPAIALGDYFQHTTGTGADAGGHPFTDQNPHDDAPTHANPTVVSGHDIKKLEIDLVKDVDLYLKEIRSSLKRCIYTCFYPKCKSPGKSLFKCRSKARDHVLRDLEKKTYECTPCGVKFSDYAKSQRHCQKDNKRYRCPWCPGRFSRLDYAQEHIGKCEINAKHPQRPRRGVTM